MRIAVGSDHRGFVIKQKIMDLLRRLEQEVIDAGPSNQESIDYPDVACIVAQKVSKGEVDRGILICGTGIGMSIAANKVPGVRAALCTDAETARGARRWNDANVLAMGLRLTSGATAIEIVDAFLTTDADGSEATNIARLT